MIFILISVPIGGSLIYGEKSKFDMMNGCASLSKLRIITILCVSRKFVFPTQPNEDLSRVLCLGILLIMGGGMIPLGTPSGGFLRHQQRRRALLTKFFPFLCP